MKKLFFVIWLCVVWLLPGCGQSVDIKFDSNGGSEIPPIVKAGDFDSDNLPTPTREGYEFIGWYLDPGFEKSIIGNIPHELKFILYAKWKALDQSVKVEHYLEDLDGNYHLEKTDNLTYETGEAVTASAGSFTGYEQNQEHPSSVLSLTVSAVGNNLLKVYYQRKTVKIIIVENGGDEVNDIIGKYGSEVCEPTLNRIGYAFDGWDQEFPSTMPDSNLTVTAAWTALTVDYQVEYYLENANDDNYTLAEVINKTADTDTLVTAEINAYPGFTEYANHPNYLTSAEVLGDGSLVLKVYYKRNIYRITYLEDGGSKVSNQDVKFGADITSPISDKIGYEFNHWYLSNEAEPYVFATMPLQDLSLTAKWTKIIYKITFETNAEISVVSITATYEDVIQAPTPPIRLGYEFIDWYEDQDLKIPYAFTIMPAKNFTLYAKWGALPYTVEFETNGGSAIDPVTAPVGTVVEKPLPTKPGFDFVNWFQDPQFINECNELTIPVGGIKLYAKWNPKDYTIIFETNGGSSILPLTASYESAINEPVLPTKEGYFFEGWYSDADFTIPFSFTTMPLDGATVYVKWLDETAQNQIANVLRQETYSHVAVKGTVFAKNNSDFYGFYLLDRTGFIYIHADHNLVDIGDYIYLEGYLNPYALINGVSNLQIISSDSALYEPVMVSYEDLSEYYAINNNYKYLSITGILINEDGYYYLFNALTNDKIKLDHRLYQEEALGVYVNQYVLLNFTLIYNKNEVQLGVINIDNSVNTVDNQMMIVRQLLHNRPMIRMLPEVSFDLVNLNIFGWGELSFVATGANASLYDPVNNCFLPTDIAKTVEFDVEINLAGTIQSLPISIVVGPRISISEFLTLPPGIYHLQGIVVMNMESIWSILKDQSGTLIIDIQDYRQVRIGDELAITVEKYAETFDFFDYQVISYEILQRNLELNNSPRILSEEDVVALSQSLDFINGEYVQVRGYVGPYCDDMYDFFVEIAGHQYPIFIGNYSAYENINKYLDHEVQLRVYLLNDEGQMCFIFADTRGDMQIPVYSDQELVNYLQAAFTRTYAGKVFYPCDTFVYHNDPLYAASISWEMDRETAKYFNFRYNRFLYVDNAVDVNIDITITMNEASVTFRYHTTLEPKTTTAAEFKNLKAYEKVFIEGVVVYRHPKYIYLLTDDELIFVNMYDLDVYIGDRVILYGIKQIRNYYYGEPYLIYDNNSNIMTILKVISRDNSYNLVSVPLPVAEIYQLDPENPSSYTRYIEVSGTLIKKESNYYLTNGNQLLLIDYVDEYTMYNQLAPYLYTKVTLRGFISDYQYYDDLWSIRFLGRSGDIESRAYSDLEKVNLIKDYYFNAYNNLKIADSSIYLDTAHPDFGGTITYETFGDNASIINFSNNTVQPVEKITSVDVRATITFGEITDTLTFVINVIPADKPVTLITISEVLNARPGDSVTFKGTIIGIIVQYSDSYFLIQDETGVIYLRTKNYFYNYNNVGRMIQATGKVETVRGRKQISVDNSYTLLSLNTPSLQFIQTAYAELLNYDNYDQSNYGKPVWLTGQVVAVGYNEFYLTNGYDRIKLLAFQSNAQLLSQYVGYQVQVKGFYFGCFNTTDNEISIIVAKNSSSDETIVLDLDAYTDEEKVDLIGAYLLDYYQDDELWDIDQLSLITYHPILPGTITYRIVSGSEYATIANNILTLNDITGTAEIILGITVKAGSYEKEFTKKIKVKDFEIHNLDDLFASTPGTIDIRLLALVIHLDFDFVYFLIDEKIYYLEGYYSYDLMVNDEVYITGKKTIIDGRADYSYEIEFASLQTYVMYELVANPITIEEIYSNDFSINNLSEKYLEVYGCLDYDIYSNMYYLEDNGYRIYIRSSTEMYEAYMMDFNINDYYCLDNYIGHKVYIKLLFPNKLVYRDYYLLDFMNNGDDIRISELTIEEHLDCAINDLFKHLGDMTYYSGDDFYPFYYNDFHQVTYQFTLENPLDCEFIDLANRDILIVEEEKIIRIIVRAIYDEENYREAIIEIKVKPIPVSTIRDVLWGESYRNYLVEGLVQGFYENKFIILNDATGTIYIRMYDYNQGNFTLNVGDKVQIIGKKYYYGDNIMIVPILRVSAQIKVISSDNEVIKEAEPMDFLDIIAIDYLNPDSYVKFISVSGKLIFTGNYYYPSYAILDETTGTSYQLELTGQTYNEFNEMINNYLNESITVSGWLIGMKSYFNKFSWNLIYDSHIVNNQ